MAEVIWFQRDVRKAEVGWRAAWDEESEANYPAEAIFDRAREALEG